MCYLGHPAMVGFEASLHVTCWVDPVGLVLISSFCVWCSVDHLLYGQSSLFGNCAVLCVGLGCQLA